jgi:ribosomal protein L7/L12
MRERFVLALGETAPLSVSELSAVLAEPEAIARRVRDEAKLALLARLGGAKAAAGGARGLSAREDRAMGHVSCADVLAHLESYRRGDAMAETTALVENHLTRCPECRRQLAHLRQLTAMLSAWRPVRVPTGMKVEVADAVSAALGVQARRLLPRFRRHRLRRPSRARRPIGGLSAYQRVANFLAILGLALLGVAILWRLWEARVHRWRGPEAAPAVAPAGGAAEGTGGGPGAAGQETCAVILVRCGPREADVRRALGDAFGMSQAQIDDLVAHLPAMIRRRVPRAEAEAAKRRLEAAGAAVVLQ